jgi:alpha-amylase/alpha-mannosidase (GH57 family)
VRIVVHGHFYQPPRDNPWTQVVDRAASAAPFHDWNQRVFEDCYRANAYARIMDEHRRVVQVVNNYEHLSFNFGPTLLSWMESHHPITYARILAADRHSAEQRGHGNAMAQAYNHTILPLDDPRDARTQIRWGVIDFERRFGRRPLGMWLPETAANDSVLSLLAQEGVAFTVLNPDQAGQTRRLGSAAWTDERPRSDRPYRWIDPDGTGRFVDIFFYDGARSRAIAFEQALSTSQTFLDSIADGEGVSVATDGETYGHHAVFGDRTLAHAFVRAGADRGFSFTNFAALREERFPTHEVKLVPGATSWSCAHGVGRWSRDCGCSSGGGPGQHQRWRAPLRQALELLRNRVHSMYEERASELFNDPWEARDAYLHLLFEGPVGFDKWSRPVSRKHQGIDEITRSLTLLEMERQALLMFTSCAWFHHDVTGIETAQVLKHAGRCIDHLLDLGGENPEPEFLAALAEAESYLPQGGNGADVYRRSVARARVTPQRAVAHLGIASLLDEPQEAGSFGGYRFELSRFEKEQSGPFTLSTGWVSLRSESTERAHQLAFAALHLGGIDLYGTATDRMGREAFPQASRRILDALDSQSLPAIVRRMHETFGPDEFQLTDLLPEGAETLASRVFEELMRRFSETYAQLYQDHGRTLDMLQGAGFALPDELRAAAQFTLQKRFEDEIERQGQSRDPNAYWHAIEIAQQVAAAGYDINTTSSTKVFEHLLNRAVQQAIHGNGGVEAVRGLVQIIRRLNLPVKFDQAQETLLGLYGGRPSEPVRLALMELLSIAPEAFR